MRVPARRVGGFQRTPAPPRMPRVTAPARGGADVDEEVAVRQLLARPLLLREDVAGRGGEEALHRRAAPDGERRLPHREAQARIAAGQPEEAARVDAADDEADLVRAPLEAARRPPAADVGQRVADLRRPDPRGAPRPARAARPALAAPGRSGRQFHQCAQRSNDAMASPLSRWREHRAGNSPGASGILRPPVLATSVIRPMLLAVLCRGCQGFVSDGRCSQNEGGGTWRHQQVTLGQDIGVHILAVSVADGTVQRRGHPRGAPLLTPVCCRGGAR